MTVTYFVFNLFNKIKYDNWQETPNIQTILTAAASCLTIKNDLVLLHSLYCILLPFSSTINLLFMALYCKSP